MRLSIIAAMARNRVIGKDNRLPWRIPADLKRFKALTMGHAMIMGRKTYESIGRPLPGRTTIVISRGFTAEGVELARTVEEALARARGDEVFICGGAEIYRQTIDRADRFYMTLIDREIEGDTYFPSIDFAKLRIIERELHAEHDPPFEFVTYER